MPSRFQLFFLSINDYKLFDTSSVDVGFSFAVSLSLYSLVPLVGQSSESESIKVYGTTFSETLRPRRKDEDDC